MGFEELKHVSWKDQKLPRKSSLDLFMFLNSIAYFKNYSYACAG